MASAAATDLSVATIGEKILPGPASSTQAVVFAVAVPANPQTYNSYI